MCICGHSCWCGRIWRVCRSENNLSCPFSGAFDFCLAQGFSLAGNLLMLARLAGPVTSRDPPVSAFVSLLGLQTHTIPPCFLQGFWEAKFRSSFLQGKCFYWRGHLPRPNSCVCVYYVGSCWNQRLKQDTSNPFFYSFLRQALLLDLELTISSRPPNQIPRVCLSHPFRCVLLCLLLFFFLNQRWRFELRISHIYNKNFNHWAISLVPKLEYS